MAIAYFSTWTTYGTWLPGDERGWYRRDHGIQLADEVRRFEANLRQSEFAVILDEFQRRLVEKTIRDHCAIRGWVLHGVNCRSNHVHAVVTAADRAIEVPREQFKSWSTRKLKVHQKLSQAIQKRIRENWWTDRGWDVFIDDERELYDVSRYVVEGQ